MALQGCATGTVKQRAGVEEAKSCLQHINRSPTDYTDFLIRACTNNGVWVVDKYDKMSGATLATYDFVNKDYTGPETGGEPVSIEALGGSQERDFLALQKALNKALLQ